MARSQRSRKKTEKRYIRRARENNDFFENRKEETSLEKKGEKNMC